MSFLMHNNTCLLFPTSMELSQWIGIHNSLAKTVRKAARVALGKDVSKVQHFVMSGQQNNSIHLDDVHLMSHLQPLKKK